MKNNLNIATNIARTILPDLPCEFAEIRLSSSKSTVIVISGDQIDTFTSGDSIGGSVRILNNGIWSFVSFNNLGEIEGFIKKGMEISSRNSIEHKSEIKTYKTLKNNFTTNCTRDFDTISLDEKFELINNYNNILKSPKQIQNTRSIYRDTKSDYVYMNSEGSEITYNRSRSGISLAAFAKDGSIIQPFHESISGYGGYEIVENQEEMAESVVKTAIDLLSAETMPGGKYNIIADQKLSGVFIHEAFGHLSEADFVYENEKMRKIMTPGKTFGPDFLNVIDDGSIENLSGYIPFDDEGVLPEKTYLIKDGILNARLHSRETAKKMDEPLTGNGRAISVMTRPIVRMTNTYIDNGNNSKDELFDKVKDGIYAIDVIGGQTKLEMFTFSAGYGYEIKNGKKGKLYRDIVLSGNVFETLNKITKIADDKKMFGGLGGCGKGGQSPLPVSFGGPHILIEDVLVGGKQ